MLVYKFTCVIKNMQVRDDYKTLFTTFRTKLSESSFKSMSNSTSTNAAKRKIHTNKVRKNI